MRHRSMKTFWVEYVLDATFRSNCAAMRQHRAPAALAGHGVRTDRACIDADALGTERWKEHIGGCWAPVIRADDQTHCGGPFRAPAKDLTKNQRVTVTNNAPANGPSATGHGKRAVAVEPPLPERSGAKAGNAAQIPPCTQQGGRYVASSLLTAGDAFQSHIVQAVVGNVPRRHVSERDHVLLAVRKVAHIHGVLDIGRFRLRWLDKSPQDP